MVGAIAEELYAVDVSAILDYKYFPARNRNGKRKKSLLHMGGSDRAFR